MAIFHNQTFTREQIILDENTYDGCTLEKCQIVYRGGQVQLNSMMVDCVWVFEGCALNTIKLLQSISLLPSDLSTLRAAPKPGMNSLTLP
jgi:hypothetical protein